MKQLIQISGCSLQWKGHKHLIQLDVCQSDPVQVTEILEFLPILRIELLDQHQTELIACDLLVKSVL